METLQPSQVLAQNIRKVRKLRGLSAVSVARRLGFSKSKMTKLESGAQVVTVDELFAFAFVLSVAPAVLLVPWGEDGESISIAISDTERIIFDGPNLSETVFDLIIGRVNPNFALFMNPRDFANTAPPVVVANASNRQIFLALEEVGWAFTNSTVASPGGMTRTEEPTE
jgi:transcriptional regulator with XRE-family HTH domain